MDKHKIRIIIISQWIVAILVAALLGYMVYSAYSNAGGRPLTNADIPQTTKDWFRDLLAGGADFGGILGPDFRDPSEWGSYEDVDSMHWIEDEYFVIFYSSIDSAVQKKKALVCKRYAHEAIPKGDLFMKGYPHPSKMNGRKLPIYLGRNQSHFEDISSQVAGFRPGTSTMGFFSFEYGLDGIYAKGIFISPATWDMPDMMIDENTEDEGFKATLWHEMNHFMYFAKWDYTQMNPPNLWFTEGLAEYFSDFRKRLTSVGNHKKYDLRKDYRDGSSEYWVGYSAFLCLEKNFGVSKVSETVAQSYENPIDDAVQNAIPNENLDTWNNRWHMFMESKSYQR